MTYPCFPPGYKSINVTSDSMHKSFDYALTAAKCGSWLINLHNAVLNRYKECRFVFVITNHHRDNKRPKNIAFV